MLSKILVSTFMAAFTCVLNAQPAADQSPTPLPITLETWKSTLPFSFTYGGKDSAQLLPRWQKNEDSISSPGGKTLRTTYTDPATGIKVTVFLRTFDKFEAFDWVMTFENTGTADTPIIENILPLHWRVAAADGLAFVHHNRGSNMAPTDFQPLDEGFGPGGGTHLESTRGRSSDENTAPFFNFQTGDHGLIGAIGWTGDWKADFAYDGGSKSVTLTSGLKATHLLLHPGEHIRTPRILLMNWKGGDWQAAQNGWRRLAVAYYMPQVDGKPMVGYSQVGAWGGESINKKIALINWIHDNQIPIELYGSDAEWYGHYDEPRNGDSWWRERGDWYPDKVNYPNGVKPLGDLLAADHIWFAFWFEAETAMPGKMFPTQHPDWYLESNPPGANNGALMINLGNPYALKGLTDLVSGLITDFHLTFYRQDFNIDASFYWRGADMPNRVGITESKHIEGLYAYWDALRAQHPGLQIDNCAGGGRRVDLETMSRCYLSTRTDYPFWDLPAQQMLTQAITPWGVQNFGTVSYTTPEAWNNPGPYTTPEHLYRMRLAYTNSLTLSVGEPGLKNDAWVAWIKQALGEYMEMRTYFLKDFYALTPWTLQNDVWTAWQLDDPENNKGVVEVLRRSDSPYAAVQLKLHAIDPRALYSVEFRTTFDKATPQDMSGGDLSQLQVKLPAAPSSVLVFYHKK